MRQVKAMKAYLKQAEEIIGERTPAEIDYDNRVVAGLAAGMDIRRAIEAANQDYPEEALKPAPDQWTDLAGRYNYLRQHNEILKKLAKLGFTE